jgi:hypothetical protein
MSEALNQVTVKKQAELVKVGNKFVTSDLRWHDRLIAKFLLSRFALNPDKWTPIGELARTAYGRNEEDNRDKVRRNIPSLIDYLMDMHQLLLVSEDEFKPGTKIRRRGKVKIYNQNSILDKIAIGGWIDKMTSTNELRGDKISRAKAIASEV